MGRSAPKAVTGTLAEYPSDWVVLNCQTCSRDFRYLKATLIKFYGPDLMLQQLRDKFRTDCPWKAGTGICGLRYSDLGAEWQDDRKAFTTPGRKTSRSRRTHSPASGAGSKGQRFGRV